MKRHHKPTAIAAIIIAITFALAACSGDSSESICNDAGSGTTLDVCTITLPDTRRVTCIGDYKIGLSCDWTHADGADNL